MDSDRNLLFGVLALQAELIDAGQFIEACTAWAARKNRPLADLLEERGWVTRVDRDDIERLLERKLKRYGNDPTASLAAVADDRARRVLAVLDDPELRATVTRLAEPGGHVLLSTLDHVPETRERYTLTRLHAKGGIGQVWLARDATIGREVALKELRPERATDGAIWSRFLEEARITGQLEHPGIVPVYELASAGEDRPPFYTMRFVRGRTLTEATRYYHIKRKECRTTPLDQAELLNAFIGVCNAVAYAHARGVIHRDLKGQNVVLGDYGEVIVLDWGLAKLIGQADEAAQPIEISAADDREATRSGQVLGTPAYMSPEQAQGQLDRVDRRSDVYSLGAILYEILVGRPPYTGADTAEVLRRAIEARPVPPRREIAEVPAALEAVCLKAMAREPGDRYQTAAELADEIRRFLADQPVSAYREPWPRRLGRWARQHRTAVAAAAALVLTALPLVTIAALWINQERLRADRGYRRAREVVNRYLTEVSESTLMNVPGLQPLRKRLLESAREFFEQFEAESRNDLSLRPEVAASLERLAAITGTTGSRDEAAGLQERAIATWRTITPDGRAPPGHRLNLAAALHRLAQLHLDSYRPDQAEAACREAGTWLRGLDAPGVTIPGLDFEQARNYYLSGLIHQTRSAFEAAEHDYRAAIERLDSAPPSPAQIVAHARLVGLILGNLGLVLAHQGKHPEAESSLKDARARIQRLWAEQPGSLDLQFLALEATRHLATYYDRFDRPADAEPLLRDSIRDQERLVAENPGVKSYQEALAASHAQLGRVLLVTGREQEAATAYERADALLESLSHIYSDEPRFLNERSVLLHARADLLATLGRPDRAEPLYRRAIALRTELVDRDDLPLYRVNLAESRLALALTLQLLGRVREADQELNRLQPLLEAHVSDEPAFVHLKLGLARLYLQRATNAHATGRRTEAIRGYRTTLETLQSYAAAIDQVAAAEYVPTLARTTVNLATALSEEGRWDEALELYDQVRQREPPAEIPPLHLRLVRDCQRDAEWGRARIFDLQGRHADALTAWDRAIALAEGSPLYDQIRLGRLICLARGGDHARAAEEARRLARNPTLQPVLLYDLACVQAMCAQSASQDPALDPDQRGKRAETHAREAIALLVRARELGFFADARQRAHFATDPDLNFLRGRDDFQSLIAESNSPSP
ncbi:MAG: hypothetical protein KatS3mg108_0817 [Isosphaeraceae bacterium]|nr:MAG: hypothetical protein KatS3mg108_0817 [Isosphaeraceae bacterium]